MHWLCEVAERNGVEPVRFVQPSYAQKRLNVEEGDVDREAAREVQWAKILDIRSYALECFAVEREA